MIAVGGGHVGIPAHHTAALNHGDTGSRRARLEHARKSAIGPRQRVKLTIADFEQLEHIRH